MASGGVSLGELAGRFGLRLHGDPARVVKRVATLSGADEGALTFLANPAYRKQLAATRPVHSDYGQLRQALAPQKSALTSAIEREPLLIPKTEYGEPVLTMEVVLPGGDLFRTGSASVGPPGETQTDLVGPSGPGLDWYRLFQGTQGTFCVVILDQYEGRSLTQTGKGLFYSSPHNTVSGKTPLCGSETHDWCGMLSPEPL